MRTVERIEVITHYPEDDKECLGDYIDIEIVVTGSSGAQRYQRYGDHYHDNGSDKAEGFVDALQLIYGEHSPIQVSHIDKADREGYE